MNYHIISQDKFFQSYIEDIYKIGEEANNIFFVRGEEGDSVFFSTERPVEYMGYEKDHIIERLKTIQPSDKLFVAWYDMSMADLIIESGIECKVYSFLMGGEFYNDPPEYHDFWLYDSKTKYYIRRKKRNHGALAFPFRTMYKLPYYLYDSYKHSKYIREQYKHKLATLKRLDFIVAPKEDTAEIDFIKKLYPTCHAEHAIGTFNQNLDLAGNVIYKFEEKQNKPLKILLGNSGDPTNNHMDAIKYMNSSRLFDSEIYCPLSYGDKIYIEYIEKWMQKQLGERFFPLNSFMARDEYVKFLSTIDIFVMNHNRQQAVGNIITALVLGKPVFMKKESVTYRMFKRMNVQHVYDIKKLAESNIDEIRIQTYKDREKTIKILSQFFSENTRLKCLKKNLCK